MSTEEVLSEMERVLKKYPDISKQRALSLLYPHIPENIYFSVLKLTTHNNQP